MQLIKTNDLDIIEEIKILYIDAFSSGISQQYIDFDELDNYIRALLLTGYAIIAQENDKILGALLCCPLTFDKLLPESISHNYPLESAIYIAEMMVQKSYIGKGIGKKLIIEFINSVDRNQYTDTFIRVWDKNIPALSLYEKTGFKRIASIRQTKTKADGSGNFVMNKIYLHQKLN